MTTDFRALCAELIENLEIHCEIDVYSLKLINRARAALAAEPVPPADGEVAELVAWLRCQKGQIPGSYTEFDRRIDRAADLLERLASPACVVLKPSPELIEAFKAVGPGRVEPMERLALQPEPEVPSDEELLETWHGSDWFNEGATLREFRSIARAVLARWGNLAPQPAPEG